MAEVLVSVSGCDDGTYVEVEATEEQFEFLKMVAEAVTEASEYSCMPTMNVSRGA